MAISLDLIRVDKLRGSLRKTLSACLDRIRVYTGKIIAYCKSKNNHYLQYAITEVIRLVTVDFGDAGEGAQGFQEFGAAAGTAVREIHLQILAANQYR